jgi:hypothetical protein
LALKKVGGTDLSRFGTDLSRFGWFVDLAKFRVNGWALKKVGGTDLVEKGGWHQSRKVGGTD